jgi:polysaccharide pyruvyl transferase WcaK-like protein
VDTLFNNDGHLSASLDPRRNDMKAKKFLISQAYTTYNKGEVAIALSIIETIRRINPDAEISIMTPDPQQAARQYSKYNVKIYGRLFDVSVQNLRGIHKVIAFSKLITKVFLYLLSTKVNLPKHSKSKRTIDLFRDADVFIVAGGGTFGGSKYRSITGNLFPIFLAKTFGKKTMVFAPSVEPFTSHVVKLATRFAFNRADMITVREQFTFDQLKSLKIQVALHLTADPAFLIGHEPIEVGIRLLNEAGVPSKNGKLLIGMTIRDWSFPRQVNSQKKRIHYLDTIKQAMERILSDPNDSIVLFTTSIRPIANDDDRITAKRIRDLIREDFRERVFVLTEDYTPEETKAMIGAMDVFIATRFHSAVFALSMKIPVLMIATEPNKNVGLMEMLGLLDFTLDASSVTVDNILKIVNRLVNEREMITRRIEERLPDIKKRSLRNEDLLRELLLNHD